MMNEAQIKALKEWLYYQTYSGVPGTDGDYLRAEELNKFLPEAINRILEEVKS